MNLLFLQKTQSTEDMVIESGISVIVIDQRSMKSSSSVTNIGADTSQIIETILPSETIICVDSESVSKT